MRKIRTLMKGIAIATIFVAAVDAAHAQYYSVSRVYGSGCVGEPSLFVLNCSDCSGINWYVDGGGIIEGGQGTTSLRVVWNSPTTYAQAYAYFSTSSYPYSGEAYSDIYTIANPVTPAVALTLNNTSVCEGTGTITFTAAPTNGGSSPYYSWYVDGTRVGSGYASTFNYSTVSLSAGTHSVYVVMTSNAPCPSPNTATSSTKTIYVNARASYTPLIHGPSQICSGTTSATFYTTVSGTFETLSYQWFKNDSPIGGETSDHFTTSVGQDYTVYCLVSSTGCVNSPTPTDTYSMTVSPMVSPEVNITVSGSNSGLNFCSGDRITFTASSSYITSSSTYTWYLNGNRLSVPSSSKSIGLTANSSNINGYYYPGSWVSVTVDGLSGTCLSTTSASDTNSDPTVSPVPNAGVLNYSICSGSETAIEIQNVNGVTGTTYSWTVAASNVTGTANGNGVNVIRQTLSSADGVNDGTATYTITPTANGCNGPPVTSVVTVKPRPAGYPADAGTDQTGPSTCGASSVTLAAVAPVVGTGKWSIVSGLGGTVNDPTNRNSIFSGTPGTTYTLRWTVSNSPCDVSTDDVIIKFNKLPTAAKAGLDQTDAATCGASTVTLAANAPQDGTGQWSIITGTGGSISDLANPSSTFGGVSGNTYTLRWTISNSPCTSSTDDVTIKFNRNPSPADAGTDQIASNSCGSFALTLAANAPAVGSGSWNVISGSGGSFVDATSPTSVFNGIGGMTYVLRWTISNPPCSPASDELTISYPSPVITSVGNMQYLSYGNTINLSAGCYDSYQWKRDGVVIPGATDESLVADEPGVYTVTVTGSSASPEKTSAGFTIYDAIPSQNQNYISTITFQKEGVNADALFSLKAEDYSQSTVYFDGLGRPMQNVVTMGSPSKKDIVTPVVYDDFDREFRKYLPFVPNANTGRYIDNSTIIGSNGDYTGTIAGPFYDSPDTKVADDDGDKPFAETKFEASPLNRVIEQGAPGSVWHPDGDKTIKMSYETNATDEVLSWRYVVPTGTHPLGLVYPNPTDATAPNTAVHYDPNQLFKNVTKDEQDHEVIEYKDKEGRVVLKRVQAVESPTGQMLSIDDTNYASTYYIYDDFGQLVCVMPPEATKRLAAEYYQVGSIDDTKETFLRRWAFRYRYDERKRMVIKQVPGADSVVMVYDKRDRLVFTQDGVQRTADKWSFTRYDELNRPIMTGIYAHGSDLLREDLRDLVEASPLYETYDGNASTHGYSTNMFSNTGFVQSGFDVVTVTYYDVYDFKTLMNDVNGDFDYQDDEIAADGGLKGQETGAFPFVKNQVTGTKTRVLDSPDFLWSVNYYDDHYRVIQSTSSNNKDGFNRLTNVYDFVGKVLRTKTRYVIPGQADNPDTKIYQRFSYDHAGRLLKTWHQIEGGPEVVISSNEYNELGQLVAKKLHQTSLDVSPVTADPLADQEGTTYDTDIASSSYSSAANTYVAANSIRLLPGFTVPLNSTFHAKIGYSAEDALAYNNSIDGEYLQTIDYRYNIRGWLTKINEPSDPLSEDLFNMELAYNTPSANGGAEQFNGNISEAIWKSAGLDKQSYGYDYDPMNRIMKGLYYNMAKPIENGYYDEKIGDPGNSESEYQAAYDLNGNIQNLLRNGKTDVGTYGLMDKLHYDYGGTNQSGGNKLMFVSDAQATTALEEGFKEAVETETDYAYDANGNLTKDENKGIIIDVPNGIKGIEYNFLNLPSKVSKSATEYIVYTYDATGRKLAQQVFGTTPKTTEYVGDLVFEDNVLQFILQPEGRVVKDTDVGAPDPWEYQYFLKDHLGNTRVVFSEKTHSTEYKATLEDDRQSQEMADFFRYPSGGSRSSLPVFDHTDAGATYTYSQLLTGANGSSPDQNSRIGLSKSFEVNPGDVFDLEVYAKYEAPMATPTDVNGLFSAIVNAFSLGAATSPLDGAAAYSAFEDVFAGGSGWINSSMWNPTAPKAYLNYLLFDENFVLVDAGFDQVSTDCEQESDLDPIAAHDYLSLHVKVEQKGYLYVYLSNEQPTLTNVYFDDMKIIQYSAVEQVNDYYPFGLTFNSYQRENSVEQRWKFQGQEHIDDLGLNWDSFKWRNYQPDIGRFFNIDPLAEKYVYNSPYAFSENKLISYLELEGLEAVSTPDAKGIVNNEIKKVESIVMPVVNKVNKTVGDVVAWLGDKLHFTDNLPRDNTPRRELNDLNITIVDEKSGPDVNNTPKPGPNSDNRVAEKSVVDALHPMVELKVPLPADIGQRAELLATSIEKAVSANEARTKVVNNVMSDSKTLLSVPVRDIKDTVFNLKNSMMINVRLPSGKDTTLQISKTSQ